MTTRELQSMDIEALRRLASVSIVMDSGKPVAALIPYSVYLSMAAHIGMAREIAADFCFLCAEVCP